MMTTRPHLRSTITLVLTLLFFIATGSQETHATTDDAWWNKDWPYRIPLQVDETGTVTKDLNFSKEFEKLGISNALLDLRSLRLIPSINGITGDPVPFEETFSQIISDADQLIIDSSPVIMEWMIWEESTTLEINNEPKTQGDGSLHAHIEISDSSQTTIGFYFDFNDSTLGNWSNYDVFLYDIYPDVNDLNTHNLPKLFSFKLEGLKNCPLKYIDGPELGTNRWNEINIPLSYFGTCCYPDYSSIDSIQFLFNRESNNYLEIGDSLDFWLDYLRLFDQEANGQIIWNAEENIDMYYLYFDLLRYEDTRIYFPIVFR